MPLALPGGYVEVSGFSPYLSISGSVAQLMVAVSPPFASGLTSAIQDWVLIDNSFASGIGCPGTQGQGTYELRVSNGTLGVPLTTVYSEAFGCTDPPLHKFAPALAFSETLGPYRLGMTVALINPLDPKPHFPSDYRITFHWFADENTQRVSSFAGITAPTQYMQATGFFGPTPAAPFTPIDLGAAGTGSLTWAATVVSLGIPNEEQCRFTGLTAAGVAVDTSLLHQGSMDGSGSGNVTSTYKTVNESRAATVGGPFYFTEAGYVPKFGGGDIGATLLDADGVLQTSGVSQHREWFSNSWGGTTYQSLRSLNIQAAWALAQNPPLPTDDLSVPYRFDPPNLSGSLATDYLPVTVTLAEEKDVNRPDGLTPSTWAPTGDVTVTENPTSSVFDVGTAGASVLRTLSADWKHRVGLFGTGDPLFFITAYERTLHYAGEDIYGWSSYGYLRMRITAPAAGTLTFKLTGTTIAVSDSHETSLPTRIAAYVVTPTAWEATYSVAVVEGANEVFIDLLFPSEEQPFYPDRIDTMQISGFGEGVYTLTDLSLVARGAAYLKWAWGKQVQRDDYSAWGLSVNGAFVYGKLPDLAVKPDEIGTTGGDPRYVNPLTGTGTGEILDATWTLEEMCSILSLQEGLTVAYSQAVRDAACKDAYGNELIDDLAFWMKPLVPYSSLTPGTGYQPDCAVIGGQVQICTLIPFSLVAELNVWGGLEALVTQDGGRAPAGAIIGARRVGGTAIEATGVTDSDGFVICTPVPANGIVDWELTEV